MRVAICGGGVIGACTAYFLTQRGIDVTVVERTEVAAAASGKAGGFLALDWCSGSPLDALARRSFGLHAALRHEIAGDWGYRRMTAYSGFVVSERDDRRHKPAKLDWLSEGVVIESRLGTTETTAIVHPRAFTAAMMGAALKHGAELRHGRVTGIVRTADGSTVRGVEVDDGVVESDAVVVAMGPWSVMAAEWMALPAVYGRRSPSLVYDTGMDVPGDALFLEYTGDRRRRHGRSFPKGQRAHLDHRLLRRAPTSNRPGRSDVRPKRGRSPSDYRRAVVAGTAPGQDHSPASLLPPDHPGRPALDRQSAEDRGRLRGNRTQCVGYPQRASDRGSLGGANR